MCAAALVLSSSPLAALVLSSSSPAAVDPPLSFAAVLVVSSSPLAVLVLSSSSPAGIGCGTSELIHDRCVWISGCGRWMQTKSMLELAIKIDSGTRCGSCHFKPLAKGLSPRGWYMYSRRMLALSTFSDHVEDDGPMRPCVPKKGAERGSLAMCTVCAGWRMSAFHAC